MNAPRDNSSEVNPGPFRWLVRIVLAVGFLGCGALLLYGWNKGLIDQHGFRQTQTAISVYTMLQEGFSLDYQTPVLGKPWAVPFEFPLYQALVAGLVKLTGFPLDQCGRAVSLFFWVACVLPLHGLLRRWPMDRAWRWATILLIWSTPTYLFWSRTFLIESIALFLSLMYLWSMLESLRRRSWLWLLLALACGTLAGVQKATTYLIVVVPLLGFASMELWTQYRARSGWKWGVLALTLALAIPLLATIRWTRHADALKARNPLTNGFLTSTSAHQKMWIYGSLEQRQQPLTWRRILSREHYCGLGRYSRVLLALGLFVVLVAIRREARYRLPLLILVAAYLAGPVVFTNLFYHHDYYFYETQIYLMLAFALALYALTESFPVRARDGTRYGLVAVWVVMGWLAYGDYYLPDIQRAKSTETMIREFRPLAEAGAPRDVLVIYGWEWDSTVPYYSGRKAIMHYDAFPITAQAFQASLDALAPDEKIAAMVVSGARQQDAAFIAEHTAKFGLQTTPLRTPWGDFYLRKTPRK